MSVGPPLMHRHAYMQGYFLSLLSCNRSDGVSFRKKMDDLDNVLMELEVAMTSKKELGVAHAELSKTLDTLLTFKKDVAKFVTTVEKTDMEAVFLLRSNGVGSSWVISGGFH